MQKQLRFVFFRLKSTINKNHDCTVTQKTKQEKIYNFYSNSPPPPKDMHFYSKKSRRVLIRSVVLSWGGGRTDFVQRWHKMLSPPPHTHAPTGFPLRRRKKSVVLSCIPHRVRHRWKSYLIQVKLFRECFKNFFVTFQC